MKFQNILFLILISLSVSCQTSETTKKKQTKVEKTENQIIQKTYTLKNFNKSCCIGIVAYSLKKVDGFKKSEANTKKQQITVWYEKQRCNETEIKNAINKTPYKIVN
ncbi:heavy-metal-associated domain-containing protein [Aureivirga marina]|uniref:heavy-metal-associated domain-containing protein n=1 Tax=Aureivirga marina TaxID=1182451 RepID=UPI0018CB5304|nr:heavy-metal-associated domain-containing protein [Aureivirga marina]